MDIIFGIKFVDAPTLIQKLGMSLIKYGCKIMGFDFEVK